MNVDLILFPGTNREQDMMMALKDAGASNIQLVWHKDTKLNNPDLIVLPGGFSYGDYLRCGAMAAHSPVMKEVIQHAQKGTRVFGVCNGFQMLIETQLLPGALLKNKSLKFICKNVGLKAEADKGILEKGSMIKVPVAHGDGNYFANEDGLKHLEDNDMIAFRYCNDNGEYTNDANINGSSDNIAGIYNKEKTIIGMMPHPENATLPHQGNQSAQVFFRNLLNSF